MTIPNETSPSTIFNSNSAIQTFFGLQDSLQWGRYYIRLKNNKPQKISALPVNKPLVWSSFTRAYNLHPDNMTVLIDPTKPFSVIDLDNKAEDESITIDYKWENHWSPWLKELTCRTYSEYSWSGRGIHIFINIVDKPLCPSYEPIDFNSYAKSIPLIPQEIYKPSEIMLGKTHCVTTFNVLPESPLVIANISLDELIYHGLISADSPQMIIKPKLDSIEANTPLSSLTSTSSVNPKQLEEALFLLPLDENNTLIYDKWYERFNIHIDYYDYWRSIGMALHHCGQTNASIGNAYALLLWARWSLTDPAYSHRTVDDIHAEFLEEKWRSFSTERNETQSLTANTIFEFAKSFRLNFPILSGPKLTPSPDEWDNVEAMIEYYGLRLYRDNTFYLTGNKNIIQKFFMTKHQQKTAKDSDWMFEEYWALNEDGLYTGLIGLASHAGLRHFLSRAKAMTHLWTTQHTMPISFWTKWCETPFNDLPPNLQAEINTSDEATRNATIEYLFSLLNVTEHESMAYDMFKATMFQISKFMIQNELPTEYRENNGLLLLLGPQETGKTAYIKSMLPPTFRHMRNGHASSWSQWKPQTEPIREETKPMRDFAIRAASCAILQFDEIEAIFGKNAKMLAIQKKLLSENEYSYGELYEKTQKIAQRRATFIGSTNARQLFSDRGSRRNMVICTGNIVPNLAKLDAINFHHLYHTNNQLLREECKVRPHPWLIKSSWSEEQTEANIEVSTSNNCSLDIRELFDFSGHMPSDYLDNLPKITEIAEKLKSRGPWRLMNAHSVIEYIFNKTYHRYSIAEMKNSLEAICGQWTGSLNKRRAPSSSAERVKVIYNGMAMIYKRNTCTCINSGGEPCINSAHYNYHPFIMGPANDGY
jgi:hypothetical protein